MRHKQSQAYAYVIDSIIDHYRESRKTEKIPRSRLLLPLVSIVFPAQKHVGKGYFKSVFNIVAPMGRLHLALKIGRPEAIEMDWGIYMMAKQGGLSNKYFAQYHWKTKYCLLQDYGKRRKVPDEVLKDLRMRAHRAGLSDIKKDNIRHIDGRFKIVDANLKGQKPRARSLYRFVPGSPA
jgi:hypothetical protein